MKRVLLHIAIFSLISCSAPLSSGTVSAPAVVPPFVPDAFCLRVKTSVANLLRDDEEVIAVDARPLADGSCSVGVLFRPGAAMLASVDHVHDELGHFTEFTLAEGERVSLSFTEERTVWPELRRLDGKSWSDQPTLAECASAQMTAAEAFPGAKVAVRTPKAGDCSVDVSFVDEAGFRSFFAWRNPRSLDGSLTAVHFRRANGVVATVGLRPVFAE